MASSTDDVSESVLLSRIREGDADSLDTLLRRHYRTIFAFAYRIVGEVADAEEITQEAVLKIARSIKSFRGNAKLTTWLYRVTLNAAYDHKKKEKRHAKIKDREGEMAVLRGGGESSSVDDRHLLQALSVLNEKERMAVVLTIYEEMTHAEAAEILNCAETTVSWRVFTAKGKLRKYFEGDAA